MEDKIRKGVFIDPKIDFSFKRLFGRDENKELLVDFLNEVFRGEYKFSDVVYNDKEQAGRSDMKSVVYDIYCTTDTGVKMIVEMQFADNADFLDRSYYYISRALNRQLGHGDRYKLKPVIGVFIVNFSNELFTHSRHDYRQIDETTGLRVPAPFRMIYFSLPNFNKSEEECVTKLDKWLYLLKNMENLNQLPWVNDPVFRKLAEEGAIENLSREEYEKYEHEIDDIRITLGTIKMNREEGREEGVEAERRRMILAMKSSGLSDEQISDMVKIPLDYVKNVK